MFLSEQRSFTLNVKLLCETECEGTCMSSLCVLIRPDLTHWNLVYMCVCVCVDFQWIVVMYLCLDSCFLAGVTKRLCVCVWARSERSHCAPALIYLRLHEAKTASVISFSHTYNDCSNISIILVPLHQRSQRLGAKLLCFDAAPLKRAICCKAATYRKSAAS